MALVDTHVHLDFPRFDKDREEVIIRARESGLNYIVNIGADLESSRRSVELANKYPFIYATVGVHPHDAKALDDVMLKEIKELARQEKVVAIGEIGLDYHYDNSPRDIQQEVFRKQFALAKELRLPVVIHSREADVDTMKILKEEGMGKEGGILHCFGSDLKMARECLCFGLYLAFGGVITFNNAVDLRKVVQEVPLDRILIETDCPYLTPTPHRGKRNEPAFVRFVAETIAEIKGISYEEVSEITTENALKVYNLIDN